jgi:MFS family permease
VFPIFPIVGKDVGLSAAFIGVILSANRAVRVVCAPWVGVLTDRIGGRRTLLIGLALQIAVIALYLIGFATHHEGAMFLAGRVLYGPATACVFIAASALSLHTESGAAAAMVRAASVIGMPIGFAIGGLAAEPLGNAATFGLAGAAVLVALAVGVATIPDVRAAGSQRPTVVAALRELRDRRVLGIGGINFALNFAAGGMVLSTLAFLVASRHLVVLGRDERGTSGLLMAVMSATDAAFTTYAARLGDRHHAHARIAAASLAIAALGLVVIALAGAELGTAGGIAIVGVGAAGLGPSVLLMIGSMVPAERRGTAAGLLQLFGDTGAALGPLLGTALFAESTRMPYLVTAGLMASFIPVALWLARSAERAR